MKSLRLLALAVLGLGPGLVLAFPPGTPARCCVKAAEEGKTCTHECCIEAARRGLNCVRCGGKNPGDSPSTGDSNASPPSGDSAQRESAGSTKEKPPAERERPQRERKPQ